MATSKNKNVKLDSDIRDFEINGIQYTTVKGNFDCSECVFFLNTCDPLPRPSCISRERKDKTNVIFKLKENAKK